MGGRAIVERPKVSLQMLIPVIIAGHVGNDFVAKKRNDLPFPINHVFSLLVTPSAWPLSDASSPEVSRFATCAPMKLKLKSTAYPMAEI